MLALFGLVFWNERLKKLIEVGNVGWREGEKEENRNEVNKGMCKSVCNQRGSKGWKRW